MCFTDISVMVHYTSSSVISEESSQTVQIKIFAVLLTSHINVRCDITSTSEKQISLLCNIHASKSFKLVSGCFFDILLEVRQKVFEKEEYPPKDGGIAYQSPVLIILLRSQTGQANRKRGVPLTLVEMRHPNISHTKSISPHQPPNIRERKFRAYLTDLFPS